jgi:DNA-directed RNA polymerase subunit RPC12/RpoP
MIAEISSFVTSVRTAIEMGKGIFSTKKAVEIQQKILPFLEKLIVLEKEALAMQVRIRELEEEKETYRKKVLEFEKGEEIVSQYELKEVAPGIRVYIRRGTNETDFKKVEWVCPYCFSQRIKSSLQREYGSQTSGSYICIKCKSQFSWDEGGDIASVYNPPSIGKY